MKTVFLSLAMLFVLATNAQVPYSVKIANTIMNKWKDSMGEGSAKWTYDQGVVLKGIEGLWLATSDPKYFKYIQHSLDRFISNDGTILTYKMEDFNLDNVLCGRLLLTLYRVTGQEKYYHAANTLRQQLKNQPRTMAKGFWHKKRYPNQMWLDGLYMAEPFYAEWSALFKEDNSFTDIANQFVLMEKNAREATTG